MIQPNELRIGNLLEWEDDSHSTVVLTGVIAYPDVPEADVVYYNELDGSDHGSAMLYEFIPIPLSEDWLKRFGFVQATTVNEWVDTETGWFMIFRRDKYYRLSTPSNLIGTDFEHVHQLQNLYFALTGEELTLSE